jgi:cytochrome c oxidase cbb3-type subunit 1
VAFLWWWAILLVTGWVFFLPGVLDHFKFTDGLVGHSFIAMAGFASSLLIFAMVQLLGEGGWIFNRTRSFYLWNGSVIAYIVLMTRNILYALRLVTGILMLLAALDWLVDATTLLREPAIASTEAPLEKIA